jgi:autotransporter passenger strand-loop-strand repeat protein/autotransporter-associated beta strand protein
MTIAISSGVTSSGLTISSGDPLVVLSGGTVESSVILSGGMATLSKGAFGSSLTVSKGGAVLGPGDLMGSSTVAGALSGVTIGKLLSGDNSVELTSGASASGVTLAEVGFNNHYGFFVVSQTFEIDKGATATGTLVSGGSYVEDFGSASGTVIGLQGEEAVFAGGVTSGDIVQSEGNLALDGGTAVGATVQNGGTLDLGADVTRDVTIGDVTRTTVLSGVTVSSGGAIVLDGATVLSGVTVSAVSGGIVTGTTVNSGATLLGGALENSNTVAGSVSGAVVQGYVFDDSSFPGEGSSELDVLSGGTAVDVDVDSYSSIVVFRGATATGTSIAAGDSDVGGYMSVYGSGARTTVGAGCEEDVFAGGAASGDTVQSGGTLGLYGGAASGETVLSGGTLDLGGDLTSDFTAAPVTSTLVISGVTVSSGGAVQLNSATVLSGVTVSLAGTVANDLTVSKGGSLLGPGDLDYGVIAGSASGVTVVDDSDVQIEAGGRATAMVVSFASELEVYGAAVATLVESGGAEDIHSGGAASGDTVQSGGELVLESGGGADGDTVLSGGTLVFDGKLASNLIAQSSQSLTTLLSGVTVSSGGAIDLDDVAVLSGVTLSLAAGAIADSLIVSKGGAVQGQGQLDGGAIAGFAGGVTLGAGDRLEILSGGKASGLTLVGFGSVLQINSGASAARTLVSVGTNLRDFGLTEGTVITTDGEEEVYSGGVASGDAIEHGGVEFVLSGGVADGAAVLSGGFDRVSSGGVAFDAVVSVGGTGTISSGGTVFGLTALSGGLVVDDGEARFAGAGTLDGTLAGSGAIVQDGTGDLVLSGAGAAFSGKLAIEGGTVELATSGALGNGYVEFAEPSTGSAVLQIDAAGAPAAGGTFANTIVDFSGAHEDIDLRSIAFVAGATATVSGSTLVLNEGGATYKFKLGGTIAGAYPVLSDGHGGTLIDPQVARFAQTAAAFAPSDAAKTALVSSASPIGQTPLLHATVSAAAGHP